MPLFTKVTAILRAVRSDELMKKLAVMALLFIATAHAIAQQLPPGCGVLRMEGRFGPYDYRPEGYIQENTYRSHKALLFIVENAHFTPEVESLIRGKTSAAPGHDISYTLHSFPNHHRALIAMTNLSERERSLKPSGSSYPVECWFSRAIAFKPDDTVIRLIYANFLVKAKRNDEAEQQLNVANGQAGDNAFTYNNIGLIYFDMKDYDKALVNAHKAIALGLRTPSLPDLLKSVSKWNEPVVGPPSETATNPQQSASKP